MGPPARLTIDTLTLDDLPWNPHAAGVGALLMTDPSLPRDAFGHPYQPLFWFDEASRPIGLIVDGDDRVLAWENNAKGNPDILAGPTCQRLPDIVEAAARQWWSNQVAPPLPG
jgi:hypothetical protein